MVNLDLIDTRELVFNRVLDGHELTIGFVQRMERGVQRRCFSRARRPGYQDHARGLFQQPFPGLLVLGAKAQLAKAEFQAFLVQDTHDDARPVV